MRLTVTSMEREKLSPVLLDYLKRCGESQARISGLNKDSRLFHDLGIYGDIAWEYMRVLRDEFKVDISKLNFENYFPFEFPGKTRRMQIILWLCPFLLLLPRWKTVPSDYEPITLQMIETAIFNHFFP